MKAGFETFDVIAIVAELRRTILGHRLVNVYDANNKTYMLKLSSSSSDNKLILLIESGTRMHLTDFSWPKSMMPLGFTMKLRKHIKNKKLSNIEQLGIDRLVDLTFGFDEHAFHLIVELYGKGNMFLTDAEYTILHLLRPRTDLNQDVRYATQERFPIELARPIPVAILDLEDVASLEKITLTVDDLLINAIGPWNTESAVPSGVERQPVSAVLSTAFPCGSGVLDHCCCLAGLASGKKSGSKINKETPLADTPGSVAAKLVNFDACRREYSLMISTSLRNVLLQLYGKITPEEGSEYPPAIILGTRDQKEPGKLSKYENYYPLRFAHLASQPGVDYPTFNKAVDEFYSSLESRKTEGQILQNEKKASKKVENIRRDQEQRLQTLTTEQVLDNQKASLLQLNADLVDQVLYSLNYALANQTSWEVLESVVEEQKKKSSNDPITNCIQRLQLSMNQAVLRLSDPYNEEENPEFLEVIVDLDCNALQNAEKYYDHRRLAERKAQKTVQGTNKALKMASKKAEKTNLQVRGIPKISKSRKPYWFEKFHWFISSENYLVLAGRDASQNEHLIKRYFRQHDIYVHADIHGASSVIVKARKLQTNEVLPEEGKEQNEENVVPQPPMKTLIEAGQMAVALSNAWSAKVITNAWWVRFDQVSKTAPTGEYLTTGSFIIRGRKHLLPQCHLVYGFGILFRLGEDSIERHHNERSIDHEAVKEAENQVRKYETPASNADEDDSDPDDLTKGFGDISLKLNINFPKPQQQRNHQTKKSRHQANSAAGRKKIKLSEKETAPPPPTENSSTKGETVLKRGQKSKLKKIKDKYGDQDDEERKMCLLLLQGANAKLSVVHDVGKHRKDSLEPVEDVNAKDENASDTEGEEQNEKEEVIVDDQLGAVVEEPEEEDNVEEARNSMLQVLDSLTSIPDPEDTLLFALPFCAPYSALAKYKYKAKLIPGTMKRGKITKMAIHRFVSDKSASDLEKQLIASIREEDTCRVLPGSAKITFPELIR